MTIPELIGSAAGTLAAATVAYKAVAAKLEGLVGKKDAPGDDSLRDVVMRIEGKIDAQHEQTTAEIERIGERLGLVEARVFTPPQRAAFRNGAE